MSGITVDDLKVGDTIVAILGGETVTIVVETVEDDIKNGFPGWDGHEPGHAGEDWGRWGYLDQIISVNGVPVGERGWDW